MTDITPLFRDLVAHIEQTGTLARAYFDADETQSELKADGSVVTHIDNEVEAALVTFINEQFPEDTIVAEEGSSKLGTSDFVWHIDPIDGTDNFFRKIPFTAISVARLGNTPEDSFGIVHNPITGQTFSSFMEGGVYENEKVLELTNETVGGRAIIGVGHGREFWMKPAMYNLAKAASKRFGKFQGFGCQALELAYVAANRIDGSLTYGLQSYDYAAGLYLIQASGGSISVHDGTGWKPWTGSLKELCAEHGKTIFASHAGIHEEALAIIGNPRNWADS